MTLVFGVACEPNAVVRNSHAVFLCVGALAPLEVEHVVGDVVPLLARVFSVVQLFVDAARFVHKLGAGGPAGSKGPIALNGVENELLNALARVQGLDCCAAVVCHPVDSIGP